jgi:hypothetical protein
VAEWVQMETKGLLICIDLVDSCPKVFADTKKKLFLLKFGYTTLHPV